MHLARIGGAHHLSLKGYRIFIRRLMSLRDVWRNAQLIVAIDMAGTRCTQHLSAIFPDFGKGSKRPRRISGRIRIRDIPRAGGLLRGRMARHCPGHIKNFYLVDEHRGSPSFGFIKV